MKVKEQLAQRHTHKDGNTIWQVLTVVIFATPLINTNNITRVSVQGNFWKLCALWNFKLDLFSTISNQILINDIPRIYFSQLKALLTIAELIQKLEQVIVFVDIPCF